MICKIIDSLKEDLKVIMNCDLTGFGDMTMVFVEKTAILTP